jgi:two-component system sensor histidine kinase KdpD
MRRDIGQALVGVGGVAAVTITYARWLHVTNATTIALTFLLVVLLVAATSRLWIGVMTSVAAMLSFNFFFLPPVGTLTVADPENWVALFVFLAVSLVASNLSSVARARAAEALARQHQLLEERRASELARQGEALKSALLASIGHDLRTPLTAIRVAATNLKAAWLEERERREQSDLVLAEVERLTRLFQNILEMARIDAGAIATDRRWVDPSEIIEAARSQVEQTVRARRLDIQVEPNRLVKVDPRLTAAALSHILENAAQYTPDGTPIVVTAFVGAGELAIRIRDWGPGIAPPDLPRLFERFFRGANSTSRAAGTGMGLSVTRGLLAAEGGRVWAENCPEGGAEFTIVVPAEVREGEAVEVLA